MRSMNERSTHGPDMAIAPGSRRLDRARRGGAGVAGVAMREEASAGTGATKGAGWREAGRGGATMAATDGAAINGAAVAGAIGACGAWGGGRGAGVTKRAGAGEVGCAKGAAAGSVAGAAGFG